MLQERIKRARILKGLSLQQVADALGDITKQALSKYENGKDAPNSTRLIKLANVLGVKPEYFFRQSEVVLGSVDFRKHSAFGKRQQESVKEQVREHLERYLAAELLFELEPEGLGARAWLHDIHVETSEEAEKAAEEIRQRWNLGTNPIANLTETLEEHGVKVIGLKAHEKFDGLCTEINNGRDAAIVSNLERPGERQRFNLAHELGHLVMQFPEAIHGTDTEEKLCHRFAGALLFPRDQVTEAFGEHRARIFFEEYQLAKREWGISMQAILRRLYDLEIVTKAVYQSTFRFWSMRGWRKDEPQPLPSEESFRLRQLVYRALAEELVSPSRAAELLNTSLEEIENVIANKGPQDGDQDVEEGSGL